jgi:hypothetical protein
MAKNTLNSGVLRITLFKGHGVKSFNFVILYPTIITIIHFTLFEFDYTPWLVLRVEEVTTSSLDIVPGFELPDDTGDLLGMNITCRHTIRPNENDSSTIPTTCKYG